jgi:hypothetical protein
MTTSGHLFRIGKNRKGQWVVQDKKGLCGGLFVDRAQALKFAMFENGNSPQAVIFVPYPLDLNVSATPLHQTKARTQSAPLRQAA